MSTIRQLCSLRIQLPLIAPVWFAVSRETRLFKDCEHAKLRVDHSTNFLFKLVNIRFADETLKLFIQTWEHAKPCLVISRGSLYSDLWITRFAHEASFNFLFKGCEHREPCFDHSLHFQITPLLKLVNNRSLCTWIHTCNHAKVHGKPRFSSRSSSD